MVAGAERRSGQRRDHHRGCGVALFLGACWWDARLQARQDALASAIADRQDDLARDLANQAEVLENTRFLRQQATSTEKTPKPFANMNLIGAELGGLYLSCSEVFPELGCADFRKADLREANLDSAYLSGATFKDADLHKANLTSADLNRADLRSANLGGTDFTDAEFRHAKLHHATLAQTRSAGAL